MRKLKKLSKTLIGTALVLIGLIFIILPGPAILFIPLGLVLLATEYDFARGWLRKYQRWSSKTARQLDEKIRDFKYRQRR